MEVEVVHSTTGWPLPQRIEVFNQYTSGGKATTAQPRGAALTADIMQQAARAVIDGGVKEGLHILQPYAVRPLGQVQLRAPGTSRRLSTKERRDIDVLVRDGFRCRYCATELIIRPMHELFALIFPDVYPYHSNGKMGYYHPAQWWLEYASDHVIPRSKGGSDGASNRVAACWWHNAEKRDIDPDAYLHTLSNDVAVQWRGLTDLYPRLWRSVGEPDRPRHERHVEYWERF